MKCTPRPLANYGSAWNLWPGKLRAVSDNPFSVVQSLMISLTLHVMFAPMASFESWKQRSCVEVALKTFAELCTRHTALPLPLPRHRAKRQNFFSASSMWSVLHTDLCLYIFFISSTVHSHQQTWHDTQCDKQDWTRFPEPHNMSVMPEYLPGKNLVDCEAKMNDNFCKKVRKEAVKQIFLARCDSFHGNTCLLWFAKHSERISLLLIMWFK